MRRREKEIKERAVIIDVFTTCHIGRLGTISVAGYPMVKPLNFAYCDGNNPTSPPFSKGGAGGDLARFIFILQKKGKRLRTSGGIIGSVLRWICPLPM